MEQSRVRYEIAYDLTKQTVIVYPQWRGTRPNFQVIGGFTPENARDKVEDYVDDLAEEIRQALARVGQNDLDPFKVMITPLNGDKEVMAKDFGGPLSRVPLEDQVPVGEDRTVAQATAAELEKAEPVPHASQASMELAKKDLAEAQAAKRDDKPPAPSKETEAKATKPAAKKAAKKTTSNK